MSQAGNYPDCPLCGLVEPGPLEKEIGDLREKLAAAYVELSGKLIHASDCATSCSPAETPGRCDCDAHLSVPAGVVESESPCDYCMNGPLTKCGGIPCDIGLLEGFVSNFCGKRLSVPAPAAPVVDGPCHNCGGTGTIRDCNIGVKHMVACPVCHGTGREGKGAWDDCL